MPQNNQIWSTNHQMLQTAILIYPKALPRRTHHRASFFGTCVYGGRALRENLLAKPKESIRNSQPQRSQNDAHRIRKAKAAKWSQKGGKLEPKWREKGRPVAIGIQIAFGLHFGSHVGDRQGANAQQMGAQRRPKSRKIASKFDVHCGMRFRKATWPNLAAQREKNRQNM